jgi:plastocyanin
MTLFRTGGTALLALAIAACSDDPVSRTPSLDSRADAANAASLPSSERDRDGGRRILIVDDCDSRDPGWAPTGGCLIRDGRVTLAEFNALLRSPLSLATVGHPAWRNEPSYLDIDMGKDVKVTNIGGRLHTFTEVAQFGGGRVPPLNVGMIPAPECLLAGTTTDVPPGTTITIADLVAGIHRYQCCIHPWMRELIAVSPKDHGGEHQH